MTAELKVVPQLDRGRADVIKGLRDFADEIERGGWGDVANIALVLYIPGERPSGVQRIELSLLGKAPDSGTLSHLLLCCAAHRLERAELELPGA